MNRLRLAAASISVFALAGIAGCGPSESPPPKPAAPQAAASGAPQAPKPAADINAELSRLAAEVYVYAYPLVLTDVTREARSSGTGSNAFIHRRTLPDASSGTAPYPNADFLYSEAWLDLSQGPVLLSVPDTKNRYYLIAMLDAWTNVAASLGTRTTGNEKGEFAIVGPHWKGTLPGGVSEVRSPTDMAWLLARTEVRSGADQAAAVKTQDQYRIAPLAQRGKKPGKPEPAARPQPGDAMGDPRERVATMDAATFFTRLAMLLPGNPPTKEDAPMVEKIAKLGVVAGKPFDVSKLDPVSARSVEDGVRTAQSAIVKATKGIGSADIRNGWTFDQDVGRWGTDYGKRAVAAWKGIGVNAPEDAIFLATRLDAGGRALDGNQRYVLHFDAGKIPPADGFWSLSLYDANHHFFANPMNRFNLGSNDRLARNSDGSVDIYLSNASPGPEKAANWLPAPKGPFNVILRIYWPKAPVLEGKWVAPGIKPLG